MKIIRKFGIGLAATVASLGLLGISAPAHAKAVTPPTAVTISVPPASTGTTGTTVQRLDISWGGGS